MSTMYENQPVSNMIMDYFHHCLLPFSVSHHSPNIALQIRASSRTQT